MSQHLREELSRFDLASPLEHAHTIPSRWYFDQEIYALERQQVFGGCWQAIGRLDQVAEPGAYFTAELAGEPLVVVRNEGGLRAFFNVCRHRAGLVALPPGGKASRFRCRYHGWTYDLNGRLRGTPEFDGVADFCKEDNGLVPVVVDTWGPLVFVHLSPEVDQPLATFLSGLTKWAADLGLEKLRFTARREYELACNWKVAVDNFVDGGYHVNTVHPGLAGALDYAHYRTELDANMSVQISPLKSAADQVAAVRTGKDAYYFWVFPNLMINCYQDVMDTNLVLPLGPGRCKVIFDFYFAPREGQEAERFRAQSMAVAHQIQLEDNGICEEVQRGLASRAYESGRYSVKREAGALHFHRLLAQALQRKLLRLK